MKKELLFLAALCLAAVQAWGQTTVAQGTCGAEAGGSNLTWTLTSDGTLTISGTGDMADFISGNQPWEEHLAAIRTAVVQEGVTSVGHDFLSDCTGLTSIDLPDGLTSVGYFFLYGCIKLASIDLPDGLTSVGRCFLYGCTGLTSLTLPAGLTSVGGYFLSNCTGLTSLTLPEGLSSVGDSFLYDCRGLTSIDLPDGLTSVEGYFLSNCTGLTSLTLPAGLKEAGNYFLQNCMWLQELTVPAATPPVLGNEGAFAGVDNTIPVCVPAGSTDTYASTEPWDRFSNYKAIIASGTCGAEAGGSNLTWILTEDGTLTISGTGDMADFTSGNQPWEDHLAAIRTAVVQEGVTSVGDYFLSNCTGLTSLTLPAGLMSAKHHFLFGCTGLTSLTLPAGLSSVGDNFLRNCTGLTSITLPEELTSVGNYFLYDCTGLTSIDLPDGLTSVGSYFLLNCTGLTSLTLPAGLTSAGNYFLQNCTGLQELTVLAATPPVLGSEGAFAGVDNTIPVCVPAGSTEAYAMADGWNYFTDYRAVGSSVIGTPSLAACVTVAGGEVRLHLADNPGAHVYDLQGRLVLSTTACRFALPPGIYIIKVGDDKVKVAL